MYIEKINLKYFRNYENQELSFINGINLLIGDNAQGKTNVIEAIYLSAFTKSFRTTKDIDVINFDNEFTQIFMNYNKNNAGKITEVFIDKLGNKVIKYDGIKVKKLSSVIGEIILVVFTPEDLNIAKGSPSYRRKFIDMICCQISKSYMVNLQEYNKCLKIKNNILKKHITEEDKQYLNILNEKMSSYIHKITMFRKEILNKIMNYAKNIHYELTDKREDIQIIYESEFIDLEKDEIYKILEKNISNEIYRKTSLKGVQRDDIKININNFEVSRYGSQGQNRTVSLTLKLANFEVLKEIKNESPILLLDDIMSELDRSRIRYLLKYIENYQSIITTTDKNFVEDIENIKIYEIKKGTCKTN